MPDIVPQRNDLLLKQLIFLLRLFLLFSCSCKFLHDYFQLFLHIFDLNGVRTLDQICVLILLISLLEIYCVRFVLLGPLPVRSVGWGLVGGFFEVRWVVHG